MGTEESDTLGKGWARVFHGSGRGQDRFRKKIHACCGLEDGSSSGLAITRRSAIAHDLARNLGLPMPRLTHAQYTQLLDFIADLQQPVESTEFGARLVSLVGELVKGSIVAVDQIHEPTGTYLLDHNCPLQVADTARYFARLQQVYQQNPIYSYMQAGGTGPVVRLSDLCSRRTLERTDFYNDIFRPLDLQHQLSVIMPRAGWITTLTINRDRDLPQSTADLLQLASRHISLAHRASQLSDPPAVPEHGTHALTQREREVFHWMREGKRNGEIAIILGCASRTVEKHVENILHKTSSETRGAAVRKLERG